MKALFFAIPAGLLLAAAAAFAQFAPKDERPPIEQNLREDRAPDDLGSLVKQLETIKIQKQQLEKQEKELVAKIRAKIQEQRKAIQEIESLLGQNQEGLSDSKRDSVLNPAPKPR
jgi:hypothetical protein